MTGSTPRPSEPVEAFPIRNEEDLQEALAQIGPLLNSQPGSAGEARLEVLSILVRDYETRHHPVSPPDPIEAIKFRLQQQGLTTKALEGIIGSRARVSEVLNKKRRLSLAMIEKLHHAFAIPFESLIASRRKPRRRAR
jgi:HTH-type transcriptional regulator / antitoxin HigA